MFLRCVLVFVEEVQSLLGNVNGLLALSETATSSAAVTGRAGASAGPAAGFAL